MARDGTLLREYVQGKSESAFAEVVRSHLELVYSTALRGVGGDVHLAKDVTQCVFIDLARKAAVLADRPLTGWLYKSACFAAAKAVRSERRRQTREQEASAMQEHPTGATQDPDWDQISPVLKTVMLELRNSDREVLLLRFFQRRSLAEVGTELGLSENAARMRVERALDRLRECLTRRGVTSTAAGLALVLAQQAVSAAPIGLAASITAACAASGAAVSGSSIVTFMAMTQAKTLVVSALVAVGALTPIVLQYQSSLRVKAELDAARAQLTERAGLGSSSPDTSELDRLRREHQELMRLRGEVALLRQRAAAKPKGPTDTSEFERMKAANLDKFAQAAAEAQVLLAKAPEIPMVPANTWTNVGFSSPAATLQTLNWASAHKDTNAFLNAIGWDTQAKARADELFAALPETVRHRHYCLREAFAVNLIITFAICSILCAGAVGDPGRKGTFAELPPAVQTTVRGQAGVARIDNIQILSVNSKTNYSIAFKRDGKAVQLLLDPAGNIVSESGPGGSSSTASEARVPLSAASKVTFDELPGRVATTLRKYSLGAEIEDIDKGTLHGRTVYEAAFKYKGRNIELRVAEDGSLVRDDVNDPYLTEIGHPPANSPNFAAKP